MGLGRWVAIGIIVAIALSVIYFVDNPDEFNKLINPPPDVKFYQTSINKNEIKVGSITILTVNAINNEFEPVSVSLQINIIGENAERHLSYPKSTELGTLEHNGSVFDQNKPIQILAKDVSGTSVPFEIEANLIVDGKKSDTRIYPIKIFP